MSLTSTIHRFPVLNVALYPEPISCLANGISLRPAKKADLLAINQLGRRFVFNVGFDMPPAEFMLALEGERIVGFCRLEQQERGCEISFLGVDEDFRGRGIGRALLTEQIKRANGAVYLNTIIPEYFEQLGFSIIRSSIPPFLKKDPAWCGECPREKCRHMVFEKAEDLPEFPNSRPLTLHDQMLFRQIFAWDPTLSTGHSFLLRYACRESYASRIMRLRGNICMLVEGIDQRLMILQPIGDTEMIETITDLLGYLRARGDSERLDLLTSSFIARHGLTALRQYGLTPRQDLSDYVYRQADLADLPGEKYHPKKGKVSRFKRENPGFQYLALKPELVPVSLGFVDWWFETNPGVDSSEKKGVVTVLQELNAFPNLKGAVIIVGGKVVALTLGEALTRDTALILTEIADRSYPGVYQTINQLFCRNAWKGFAYINRMEDLGLPGLRQAKKSYYPCFLVEVFDLSLN